MNLLLCCVKRTKEVSRNYNYGNVPVDIQVSDVECCGILQLVDWVLCPLRVIVTVLAFLVLNVQKDLISK